MPLLNSYVIWNNKGGVGKTTLTFHMATQYAKRHPELKVLVIDLCPQANVTMALLSSPLASGTQNLSCLVSEGKTISSYLQQVTSGVTSPLPMVPVVFNSRNFLTRVCDYNHQIPPNLGLLCGDMLLEYVGRSLDHMREGCATPTYNPWVYITSCVRYFIEGYEGCVPSGAPPGVPPGVPPMQSFVIPGVTTDNNSWVVFIDTNPSFAVYTEMALAAAQKLIIPVNADDFSREAIITMLDLVYGIARFTVPAIFEVYRARMFSFRAQQFNVRRPLIDLVINNRATSYKLRSASAFGALYQSGVAVLQEAYQKNRGIFVPKLQKNPFSRNIFVELYFEDIQDFHTAGIVALHKGCPLEGLQSKMLVFLDQIPINRVQLQIYKGRLNRLVDKLFKTSKGQMF